MKYEVIIKLKDDVFDPESKAIHQTLERVGFEQIKSIKKTKRYIIEVDEKLKNENSVVQHLASKYLSNPVSELYSIRKLNQ